MCIQMRYQSEVFFLARDDHWRIDGNGDLLCLGLLAIFGTWQYTYRTEDERASMAHR